MKHYSLTEATTATGKSKSTILRSIRAGRISANRDELSGDWRVEPAELRPLYPALVRVTRQMIRHAMAMTRMNSRNGAPWRFEREDTIRDLRARLDAEAEERRRLTALLTDQRAKAKPPTSRRGRFLAWRRVR